jgi:hypothetical protein
MSSAYPPYSCSPLYSLYTRRLAPNDFSNVAVAKLMQQHRRRSWRGGLKSSGLYAFADVYPTLSFRIVGDDSLLVCPYLTGNEWVDFFPWKSGQFC